MTKREVTQAVSSTSTMRTNVTQMATSGQESTARPSAHKETDFHQENKYKLS